MPYKKVRLNHISLKALEIGHIYDYPIFYKDLDDIYRTLIQLHSSFTPEIEKKIEQLNIKDVYVLTKDHKLYEKDTQKYISKIIYDKNVPSELKSQIIHEMASDTMNELFQGELDTSKVDRSTQLVNDTINLILDDKSAAKAMLGVTSYDYYTYTHCVNVSIYALSFGAFLNLEKELLTTLGSAAILHDLGKKNVPNEIVNKNGKLTDEEFEVMKNHPSYAIDMLKALGETNQTLLDIIEQHHEKIDGSGYPKGLKQNDMHPLSHIVAIADIFDALTTKRSYKDALKSYDALNIMKNQMVGKLNEELLKKFIIFMSEKIEKDKNNLY